MTMQATTQVTELWLAHSLVPKWYRLFSFGPCNYFSWASLLKINLVSNAKNCKHVRKAPDECTLYKPGRQASQATSKYKPVSISF